MNTRRLFNALTPARVRRPQAAASFDRDARIGVIGAGAAGLTVARSLVQKGFRHVTVLEREGRVGGKCSTFLHEGHSYELGAVLLIDRETSDHGLARLSRFIERSRG